MSKLFNEYFVFLGLHAVDTSRLGARHACLQRLCLLFACIFSRLSVGTRHSDIVLDDLIAVLRLPVSAVLYVHAIQFVQQIAMVFVILLCIMRRLSACRHQLDWPRLDVEKGDAD